MTDPQDIPVEPPATRTRPSMIWLVPVLALVVAVGLAVRNWAERGPLITVAFSNAAGVQPNETELRHRDIGVGVVEDVRFSENLAQVLVDIRLDDGMAPFVDAEARFWVVRPQVSAQGVTGLDTVLSGVYIQGAWDGEAGEAQSRFEGFDDAPLLKAGEQGTSFRLRSDEGLPTSETPILYKGVEVGRVGAAELDPDRPGVEAEAVVLAPYDELVTDTTRFWDISGFSFSLGAGGARLNFTSLASLISGGVTFETLASGGDPLEPGTVFELHPDEETAREDFFLEGTGTAVDLQLVFEDNLTGLAAGSDVMLGGLRVGEVAAIQGVVDPDRFGDSEVRLLATVRLNPGRIGLGEEAGEEALLDFLADAVQEGLRARLANASLLTGGLRVELVRLPDAASARLDRNAEPFPILPTADSDVTDVAATAQGLLNRVNALPVEALMDEAVGFLSEARGIAADPDLRAAPAELRATLEAVRAVTTSDAVQALPERIDTVATDVQAAAAQLAALLAALEEAEAAEALTAALRSVGDTADSLPGLVAETEALIADARALPLEGLVARAESVLAQGERLIGSDAVQALPADISSALDTLSETLTALRGLTEDPQLQALPGEATALTADLRRILGRVDGLVAELEAGGAAADIVGAVDALAEAADDLPRLTAEARAILGEASDLPLQDLAARAGALLDAAEALIDQESTRALPASLNGALAELRATLGALREGGLVENANATLASARDAAEAVAQASQTLPALSRQLQTAAAQADTTLASFSRDSEFTRDLRGAIRQIQSAAEAVDRLARRIERDPNSLILGR